jgi:hypothetical protein
VSDRLAIHEGVKFNEAYRAGYEYNDSSYIPDTVPAAFVADYDADLLKSI